MAKSIGGVELREPQNNDERKLLGYIISKLASIRYGSMNFEVRVHNGKITHIKCIREEETLSLHNN